MFSHDARARIERLPNRRLDKPFRAEQLHELVAELVGSRAR
jgi:hypothetical protein